MTLTTYCAADPLDAGRQGRHRSRAERPQADLVASAGNRVAAQRQDRSCAGLGASRRPHPPGPDEPRAVEGLARPQARKPEEDRRPWPSRRHALRRRSGVHGAARSRAGNSVQGTGLRHPHRRTIRRSAPHDVGGGRSRRGDMDDPGVAHEDGQGTRRSAQRSGDLDPARPDGGARQEPARVPVAPSASGAVEHVAGAGDAAARAPASSPSTACGSAARSWTADHRRRLRGR